MKRIFLAAGVLASGLFAVSAPSAGASTQEPVSASLPAIGAAVPTSGSPTKVTTVVRTPSLPKVTVVAGDTLSGIGARTDRTWPQLWHYNVSHIPNPNLIYVGQIVTIPPKSYNPGSLPQAAPSYTPPPTRRTYSSSTTRTYTPQRTTTQVTHHYSYSGGGGGGSFTGVWACIARYESGGNPSTNTGNGYYGGLQFSEGTWLANGGTGNPASASAAEQQRVAENVVRASGGSYQAWPNTSRRCGV